MNDVVAGLMLVIGVVVGLFFQGYTVYLISKAFESDRLLKKLRRYFLQYHQWEMKRFEVYKIPSGWGFVFAHLPDDVDSNIIGDMTKRICAVDGLYIALVDIPKPKRKSREDNQEAVPYASRQLA